MKIENKYSSRISINLDELWINGYGTGEVWAGYFYEVDAGQTVEEVITLPLHLLNQIGISNVGELKVQCWVRNRETGIYLENLILGYQTEDYASMDTEMDGIKLGKVSGTKDIPGLEELNIEAAYLSDGIYADTLFFYIENTGDRHLAVVLSDLTHGENVDFSFWPTGIALADGKAYFYATLVHKSSREAFKKGDDLKMYMRVKDFYTGEVIAEDIELTYTVK